MTRRQANLLIAAAAWTLYIWISFIVIQTRQTTSVGFKVVHGVLAIISIAFAVAVGRMGWQARRAGADGSATASRPAPERVVSDRS